MPSDDNSLIALLSLGTDPGPASNRRMVAGASLLERQVDVALALGCGSIWLFAGQQDAIAVKAQILAESAGARFRIIQRAKTLLGSLRRQDRLLVLAEGLLPGNAAALGLLAEGPAILTLPADPGSAAGFERLDMGKCWGGGMILPGSVIERLEGLDDDIDPVAALLRAGRSARLREVGVPVELLADGRWSLTADRIPDSLDDGADHSMGIRWRMSRWGIRLVGHPRISMATLVAGILAVAGAAVGLALSQPAISLLLVSAAGILLTGWVNARHHGDPRIFSGRRRGWFERLLPAAADPLGAAATVAGLHTQFGWPSTLYVSGVTFSCWLLAAMGKHRFSGIFRDRALLWISIACGGLAGAWIGGAALVTAVSLAAILLNLRNQATITQA